MDCLKIENEIIACYDINDLSDIILVIAERIHNLVASDAMRRADLVVNGERKDTGIKFTVRITRDN